jgi:hypothetical protein
VAETLRLARAAPGPGRDRLLGWIREKVTLISDGRRCEAGSGSVSDAAFVAAENIFMRPVVARRWVVSFVFGLVHVLASPRPCASSVCAPRGCCSRSSDSTSGSRSGRASWWQ